MVSMIEAIKKRRSIRRYIDQKIEDEKLEELLYAGLFSPSAYNKSPWHFIIVKKDKMRQQLSRCTNFSSFAKEAPVLIVIATDEDAPARWVENCSVAAAHIYLEATAQGLGTCWIQIYDMDTPDGDDAEAYVKKLLKIPEGSRVLCAMSVGYPAENLPEHNKEKLDRNKFHTEKW